MTETFWPIRKETSGGGTSAKRVTGRGGVGPSRIPCHIAATMAMTVMAKPNATAFARRLNPGTGAANAGSFQQKLRDGDVGNPRFAILREAALDQRGNGGWQIGG